MICIICGESFPSLHGEHCCSSICEESRRKLKKRREEKLFNRAYEAHALVEEIRLIDVKLEGGISYSAEEYENGDVPDKSSLCRRRMSAKAALQELMASD